MRRDLDEGENAARQSGRHQRGAVQVQTCGMRVAALRDVPERHPHRGDRERQVDEEHPAPRRRVDEPTSDERTDRTGDARQPRPDAHGSAAVLLVNRGIDQSQASRHE